MDNKVHCIPGRACPEAVILLVLLVLGCTRGPSEKTGGAKTVPENLVHNGDFEQGTTGWRGGDAMLRAVDGGQPGKCLQIQATSGKFQYAIQPDVATLQAAPYTLTLWIKSGPERDESFTAGIWDNTDQKWVATLHGVSNDAWAKHVLSFQNTSRNPVSVEIMRNTEREGSILVDEVRLRPGPQGDEEPSAYVQNGDFERGVSGWDASQATLAATPGGQSGKCLQLNATGGDFQYAIQWNRSPLSLGASYQFSLWVKSGTAGDQPFRAGVWDAKESRWIASRDGMSTPTWTQHTILFRNDSSNPISVELVKNSQRKGSIFFDTVHLEKQK